MWTGVSYDYNLMDFFEKPTSCPNFVGETSEITLRESNLLDYQLQNAIEVYFEKDASNKFNVTGITRLWSGLRDGYDRDTIMNAIHGKTNTMLIVNTKKGQTIGAYTDIVWDKTITKRTPVTG